MTITERKKFVRAYLQSFEDDLKRKIEAGLIPENWDGIELRAWLAEKISQDSEHFWKLSTRGRRRDFKNDMATRAI